MNIIQLEQERIKLKEKLTSQYSAQARIIFLSKYFGKVLSTKNKNFINSFLPEFIPEYIFCLKNYTVTGMKPQNLELLIEQAEKIKDNGLTTSYQGFTEVIKKLKDELEKLQRILRGEATESVESKAYFPLLEEEAIKETGLTVGILESVTIKVNPAKASDKFIIVPSEKEIEEKISEQVKLSWINAIRIAKQYVNRVHPFHEVIISFDKKAGFCKGNSLGTALTLSFIEEIFRTYNSPVSIKVGDGIAFTGGMNEIGNITNTSNDIIKQKTELVFFSDISLFIVPKNEELPANEKLIELKQEYPRRDLRIIGIEDLNDLLNRRNIVEIKKQPVIVRTGKFVKKNWISAITTFLLAILFAYLFVMDFDDNPFTYTLDGRYAFIKNKNNKVLWRKEKMIEPDLAKLSRHTKQYILIADVNDDKRNEVLIQNTVGNEIICYNYDKKIIWKHSFEDLVSSERETLNSEYSVYMLDTLKFKNKKSLYLISKNGPSFASAIYRIDVTNGKSLPGTFWASGHIMDCIIKDIDNDSKPEIVGAGYENGYEDLVFFAYEIDTLTKSRPTTNEYLIRNFPISEMKAYMRFPKSDFDNYEEGNRTPQYLISSFINNYKNKKFQFATRFSSRNQDVQIGYDVSYNLKDINIVVGSDFRVVRDTLVAHGLLNPPYTDTEEYKELLKSKILYWKNGKWVKKEELE